MGASSTNKTFCNCKDTIRDEPNSVGFAREKAQTMSFVERGFGRLGLDRQAVGFSWCSYIVKFSFTPGVFLLEVGWEALVFGHISQPLL